MERIGRYEVAREIGRGGMGSVFEARDPELERRVAIKLLFGRHARLFRDEARALAALNHPGIVTIHEIGDHDGRPYLVMELLRGRPLRELLVGGTPPARERLVAICASVADAIAEAHEQGVLHRDIKPENVVVLDAGAVKVVDFGIARRLDGAAELTASTDEVGVSRATRIVSAFARTLPLGITPAETAEVTEPGEQATTLATLASSTQTVFGTPAYMAPEVLGGEPSTTASDVYSLGVLVYECLAGRRPYEAPNLVQVIAMVLDGSEPPRPLADPLWPLVARMLARDPAQRPSVREVAAALAPASPRVRHGARRAAVVSALAATTAVLGLAGWRIATARSSSANEPARAGAIAVEPLMVSIKTYGNTPGHLERVLASVLAHIDGMHIIDVAQRELAESEAKEHADTARRLGARYLVGGKIVEQDGQLDGSLDVTDLATGEVEHITAREPIARSAGLIVDLANGIAARLLPGARLSRVEQVALAHELYDTGASELALQHWWTARAYLEQAVDADPSNVRAWDALASARAWTLAPQPLIEEAIGRALAATPAGPRHTILQGAAAYLRHDFDDAVATLEPVAASAALSRDDSLDLAYYLGESLWHRGDHARGAEQLQRVLESRPGFEPAGVHVMRYAIVRRDLSRAGVLIGQLNRSRHVYQFAAGDYATIASSGDLPFAFQAQLVLGAPIAPEVEAKLGGLDGAAYRVARALTTGNVAAAREEFAAGWKQITAMPVADTVLFEADNFLDVVASSGLRDETKTMLEFLRSGTSPRFAGSYRRHAALAAPLVGTPLPADDAHATKRQRQLTAAVAAEVAGHPGDAARMLGELVADPGENFDFGERIALVRNLRALHDRAGLAALCKDIEHPPLFRYDFLLARKACRDR